MASSPWKDEVETVQSIFPEELQIVDQKKGCLLKYSVNQNTVLSIKLDGTLNQRVCVDSAVIIV